MSTSGSNKITDKNFTPALGFEWATRFYDMMVKLTMPEKQFRKLLIDHLKPEPNEQILEFGVGTGSNLVVAGHRSRSSHFTGLDVDPKILALAKGKLDKADIDATLTEYDGQHFPFGDDSFDKIYSCLVFHHLEYEVKSLVLAEINRVLKPGGQLIVADWGKAANTLMRLAFGLVQIVDGFKTTKDNVNGKLPSYLKEAGFRDIRIIENLNTLLGTFSYYTGFKSR